MDNIKQKYFEERKTVRKFKKERIPDKLLEDILETAGRAPTCGNMQLYTVIVTREKGMKEKLNVFHYNQPAAVNSDVILTVCADFNRFTRWCECNDAKPGYNNFHSFVSALTDAVIYAQQIVTIAEMQGLGTCYLGTVTYNAKEISNLLKLPYLVVPVVSIALGYPEDEDPQVERLPKEAYIHYEEYSDFTDDEIKSLFKDKTEFEPNRKYVKENNKKNLAEVFTTIRYPEDLNLQVSKSFLELLREKGFVK